MYFQVQSYQIAQHLNIRAVRAQFNAELLFGDNDEVFYKLSDTKFVYIFQFGIISFFNVSKSRMQRIIEEIEPFGKGKRASELSEDIQVFIAENTMEVKFSSVTLPKINPEMIRLVMLHTSQSVALERYGEITEQLLEEASVHTISLEQKGRLHISSSKLKKFIGRTLNIKNRISEHLYIFDAPEVTWQDEQLAKLDLDLKNTFDLKNRYRNVQDRITIIKENLELFKDIWNHKESSTLEWIIIILIFVEIIDLFVTKVF
ncbi:MAG: RMD1 family protein [Flavobacteriaceae bacterium]|nr:RMD1 family protein [Flavobacteriaceae bacterium]